MTGCVGQPDTKLRLEGHAGCHHAITGECPARKAALTWGSGSCPCCWGRSALSAEKDSAQPDPQQPICSSLPLMTMSDVPPGPLSAETHAWKAAPWGAQDLHTKNSKPYIVCAVHNASKLASYNQIASHTLKLPVSCAKQ